MILDHFWKILFVVAIAVAGFFTWKAHSEKRAFDLKASEVAALIDPAVVPRGGSSSKFGEFLYQAVALLHLYELEDPTSLEKIIDAANELNGVDRDHAEMIRARLLDNLERARDLAVFDDDERNLDRMRLGREPTIPKGPWEGEPLAVAWIVSPLLAAGALNDMGNAALVPASVQALSNETVTDAVFNHATKLKNAGVIEESDYQRIRELARTR